MTTPWIVLATIIGYFILLFVVSWLASRKSDANTALTGGREAPWYIVAIAMIGAPISGVTFVSVPGMVAAKSFSYMQMVLGFAVGYFVMPTCWCLSFSNAISCRFTAILKNASAEKPTKLVHGSSSSVRFWVQPFASMWCA